MTSKGNIAIAFPIAEGHRRVLRAIADMPALPAVPPGAIPRPCLECGLILGVGPRTLATIDADPSYTLLCPICLMEQVGDTDYAITLINLHNPDSQPERR